MKSVIFFITILLMPLFAVTGLTDDYKLINQGPDQKLHQYTLHTASHKLHLHFNKNQYNAGDAIWFRAYILNSVTHLPDKSKTSINIEMTDSRGVLMAKQILLAENGVAEGNISLPPTIPDGNYFIRAYTDWMKNFGEEYYFTRYFYINNPAYEDIIPTSDARENRRFNREISRLADDFDIAFFPEGGDMIPGVTNRIAFKAFDGMGRGMEAEGVILDENGGEIVNFATLHDGMGSFLLNPEPGISYQASVSYNYSRSQLFDLPRSRPDGISLRLERENDNILLELSSGFYFEDNRFPDEIVLIAHSRGEVRYAEQIFFAEGKANVVIPEELFPSGITHITVFTGNQVPLAERLVFINRRDHFIFSPQLVRTEHEQQEYLGFQLNVFDNKGNPVEGQFSMSVLTGDFDPAGSSKHILSNILLTSDLKGIVENPQYYFESGSYRGEELDHVMMTHGWRRFEWETVLAGEIPELPHSPSSGFSVSGRIMDPARDEPVNNQYVQMNVASGHDDIYKTQTNTRGIFVFDNLDYPDNIRVVLSSRRLSGNYPPEIELTTDNVQGYEYTPNIYTKEQQITRRGRNWERVSDAGQSPYASTSSAQSRSNIRQYGTPDQTIYIDRETVTQRTVLDVLRQRAQGAQIQGNQITFRGPTSINLSSEPMFMLDGSESSRDLVLNQSAREIERIEIFRGTSASMFGVRGAGGVIIAYSRRAGDRGFEDSKEFMITGIHSPREFYTDIVPFTAGIAEDDNPVRTIHWEPRILIGHGEENTVFFPYFENMGRIKIFIEGVGHEGGLGFGELTLNLR